jgi:hypothetical protein
MSAAGKTHATGGIDVKTYEPTAYEEVDAGPNLVEIHVTESFGSRTSSRSSPALQPVLATAGVAPLRVGDLRARAVRDARPPARS